MTEQAENGAVPTWLGLFGAAPGIDLTGEGEPEGFDARKVADKVRDRLEAVGEWTDDDGVQLRMRDGRVERR